MTWESKEDIDNQVDGFERLARQYAERDDRYGMMMILVYGFAMLARVIIHTATHKPPSAASSPD